MSSNDRIDTLDSLFIAKHILEKLGIVWDELDEAKCRVSPTDDALKATSAIEAIEETWEHESSSTVHTLGRKEKNETIKLWSVPAKSAQVLRDLVILTQSKNILEIGTSAGFSTLYLADGGKHTGGRVITIELLKEKAELARGFIKNSGLDNIELIESEASVALNNWRGDKIDFIFLDADKENYGKYLDLLLPIMKTGAMIVADNVNDYGHLMEDYLQKVTGTHLPQSRTDTRVKSYYLAALDNGLIITKKL